MRLSDNIMTNGIDDSIFDFVYEIALRDATMRSAYVGPHENLIKGEHAQRVKKYINEYISNILNGNYPNFYETESIVEKELEQYNFSFGNCQKLINMTVKYFYIATYKNSSKKKLFDKCHCPMDRIMIKKVIQLSKETEILQIAKCDIKNIDCSWSKLEKINDTIPIQYIKFQEAVSILAKQKGINPIEFDFVFWSGK